MSLKRWLLLTHLIVMLIPLISGIALFSLIKDYNNTTQFTDYISTMNKFKTYQKALENPDIYSANALKDKKFIESGDENFVEIDLFNVIGQQIYSSSNDTIHYIARENLYSKLYEIQTGTKAYTLKKPVFKENNLLGFYKIIIARENFVQGINYRTIIIVVCFLIILQLVFISVFLLLNKKFNKPIKLLIEGMNKFAQGENVSVEYKNSDEIGELIKGFNSMKKDIEDNRKTIEHQQKSREYMISAISHDLKTPLTSIRAYAESIFNEDYPDIQNMKNKATVILNKSDYMKNMIDDLLMYNLLTTDYKMDFVVLEGSELFEMLFSGYGESCDKKKISLLTDINVYGKYIADVMQMTRVVDNLMTNALRYTTEGGHIFLGAYTLKSNLPDWIDLKIAEMINEWKSDGLLVLVKNEGDNILDSEKDKIFLPFYQADDSRNKKHSSGVGLGLSIVQLVINKHQGEIKVFSENRSTIFACWIPSGESFCN